MNHFHLDWYHQQQEKKKDHMIKNDISLINQSLRHVLRTIQPHINREDYEMEARKANRYLVQSSIWDINYRNNMENEQVALQQAILICTILSKEEIQHRRGMAEEVERQMRRLGNIDWGIYTMYRREIQHLEKDIYKR